MKNKNEQLELTIRNLGAPSRPQSKFKNQNSKIASFWFQRMRQIVDSATDWRRTPPARPEQIWFHQ
jgi:hypothetical protein